jgi:hypothetical protein
MKQWLIMFIGTIFQKETSDGGPESQHTEETSCRGC